MDDECSENMEKFPNGELSGKVINVRNVLQSIWVRCCSILSYNFNREYLVRQFNFVLNLGTILWAILLFSKSF